MEGQNDLISMSVLPNDLLRVIFSQLGRSDKVSVAMVCKRWLALSDFPEASGLSISVGHCLCNVGIDEHGDAWLQVCLCKDHGSMASLSWFLPYFARSTETFSLEDDLVSGERISNDDIFVLLAGCAHAQLKKANFIKVDFGDVKPWTLALLANCSNLNEIIYEDCLFPNGIEVERFLIRIMTTSFECLSTIKITNCNMVTDGLARSVARRCPLLEDFTVSGCKSVTSHSALSLLESSRLRKPTMLTTHMENTSFDVNQLYRQIQSPYFCEPGTWKLMPMAIRIGYEKAAVMAQSTNQTCVLIYV
ncbi:unnamed protein product, partial [Mesorhabditis belari]|uniref:F-box domain-containing protein n=1 Tax=Mesorhabditis belari TaxID=2138241 RepID=A0AAF3EBN4_9BILA